MKLHSNDHSNYRVKRRLYVQVLNKLRADWCVPREHTKAKLRERLPWNSGLATVNSLLTTDAGFPGAESVLRCGDGLYRLAPSVS